MADKANVAIVTGGTRGIGRAVTEQLIADGFTVAAFYQSNDAAAKACREETGTHIYKANVAELEDVQKKVEKVEKDLGPIGVLVNNAGITRDSTLHKMTGDDWKAVMETNLDSCFNMCRAVVPGMRERRYGRIINISSINGEKGQFGQTNYSAAKAGMIGFTKALAQEGAAKGITVNALCPGYIRTDMTERMDAQVLEAIVKQIPVGRLGYPEEIASFVSFLASDRAAFVTGAILSANGGQYM